MKTFLTAAVVFVAVLFFAFQAQATPWTPAALGGNLSVWLDGQDSSTLTVDGLSRVSQWNDKSGNGNHVAASGDQRPTLFATGGVSGKQSLAFGGTQNMLKFSTVGTPTGNNSYTMLVVYEFDPTLGNLHGDHYLATFGTNVTNRIAAIDVQGAPRFVHFFNDHHIVPAPSFLDENPHFYIDHYATTGPTTGLNSMFFDGAAYGAASIANLNLGNDTLAINVFGNNPLVGGVRAHIGEVILISDALSVADRQTLEGYIAHKWFGAGALNSLPGDHPFKNAAPLIPEPSSLALASLGMLGLLRLTRRRNRTAAD